MPNAFDFAGDIAAEEEAKQKANEDAKNEIIENARRQSTMHIRPTSREGAAGDNNPQYAKSGGGLFSAGGGVATKAQGEANLSKAEQEAKLQADLKAKRFAKLYADDPEPPKMKVVTLAMMEAQRKKAAQKKRAARREAVLESLKDKGKDDGKGAQKLLTSYVDEVLGMEKPSSPNRVPEHLTEKKSWQDCSFFEKLLRPELKEVPLVSQLVAQKALVPVHTELKKKAFNDICKRLKRNDGSLVRLRLNGAGVSDSVATQLADALEKNLYAQHLMLHDNRVTDAGVQQLCTALRWHPGVHTIWLGGNPITNRGCAALANLAHVNHNLKDLNISNKKPGQTWSGDPNPYDTCISHIGAESLGRSLMRSCQLTSLNLADQRIRDQGATYIFSSLRKSFLRTLNLKNNQLTDKCCVMLRDVLIYESAADDYGSMNINNALNDFAGRGSGSGLRLEKLVLSENKIKNAGASNIAYALCYNKTLQALDLAYNQIGDEGIEELLSCLQFNQVLRSVYTIYNDTDDERVDRILEMRTAAVEELESHFARVDQREEFHNTGLVTDRTGTVTLDSIAAKKKDRRATGVLAPAQLADSIDSRGNLGFDISEGDENMYEYAPSTPGAPSGYGSRVGTADPDKFAQEAETFDNIVGVAHKKIHEDIRLRPVPAFLPVTTDALKKLAKVSKYASKDNTHRIKTPGNASDSSPPRSPGTASSSRVLSAASMSGAGESKGDGYMLHDGNKYGDNFDDLNNSLDEEPSLAESSMERTIGSNLSIGKVGRHLKLERPNTSGSVIDSINRGRHKNEPTIQEAIDILRANASNPKVMLGVKGTPQKPIDWSQVAAPAHMISVTRLASNKKAEAQNFFVKERKDLYKALGDFVPRSARRPPTKSGGGRAGSVKRAETAPVALVDDNDESGEGNGSVTSQEDTVSASLVTSSAYSTSSEAMAAGSSNKPAATAPASMSATDKVVQGNVIDQFPPNPNPSSPGSSRAGSPPRTASPQRLSSPKSAMRRNRGSEIEDGRPSTSQDATRSRSQSPGKSTRFNLEEDSLLDATGNPMAPRAGTPGGFGGRLDTPGVVIAASDGGVDIRAILSEEEQFAQALVKASNANEAYEAATKVKPGHRGPGEAELKKAAEALKFKPKTPIGRVRSAGSVSFGHSGRASPARPFRNFEVGNDLTDRFFRPHTGGNTHENVPDSVYFNATKGKKRPSSMGVADFKSEVGNMMWNTLLNKSGLSTQETRDARDAAGVEDHFTSHRYTHDKQQTALAAIPMNERLDHTVKYTGDDADEVSGGSKLPLPSEGGHHHIDSTTPSSSANTELPPISPPRSPGRMSRSRVGTAPTLAQLREEQEEDVASPPGSGSMKSGTFEYANSNSAFNTVGVDGYNSDGSTVTGSDNARYADMVVPFKEAMGAGGDMASFFSLFQDSESSSSESESDSASDDGDSHDTGVTPEMLQGTPFANEGALIVKRKGRKTRKGHSTVALVKEKTHIMNTEERDAIAQASITDKMRLGAHLPNSTFKRLFDKTGKPVLSKDLGKTMGVPNIPHTGVRPLRSATSQYRDSGHHLTYLRIATPDDPPEQRPISLLEIAKTQKEHIAKIRADRQTQDYKDMKKDCIERIPRGKQRAAAYPIPDKFWEAWRRDNRLRYPSGIDRARGTSSTSLKDLGKFSKNADGTVRMDEAARERLLIKTPGQALVYRRKEAKRLELERQRKGYYDDKAPSIGKAKKLVHDLMGLREDQSTSDLLDKKSGLNARTGTMEAVPMASMDMRKDGKKKFKAPTL